MLCTKPLYVTVPLFCNCLELELTSLSKESRCRVTVHTIQLLPRQAYRMKESQETVSLDPEAKGETVFPVIVSLLITPPVSKSILFNDLVKNGISVLLLYTCRIGIP